MAICGGGGASILVCPAMHVHVLGFSTFHDCDILGPIVLVANIY